uniref:VWFD domain-containing protein n=1 Tax=Timema shepardi TaxID=629360 RepID=A0A7R9FXU1_TIMSH|nr:unnamed protein product [Timema shepardi]
MSWYFGKTAGLLGTMDNEPSTDFLTSQKTLETDIAKFAQSWLIEANKCSSSGPKTFHEDVFERPRSVCEPDLQFRDGLYADMFDGKHTLKDPRLMCQYISSHPPVCEKDTKIFVWNCALHIASYVVFDCCAHVHIGGGGEEGGTARCQLTNGSEFMEGEFHKLENESVPRSTDIVFIVEAKDCNKNVLEKRNMASLLTVLSKELISANIKENRFSLVVFGGDGVLDLPRSIVVGNNVFSEVQQFLHYFENIPTGNGNSDIFGALRFATNLLFRPAVAKTFILLPCTTCDPSNMTTSYPSLFTDLGNTVTSQEAVEFLKGE